jgi:hypothetical protein
MAKVYVSSTIIDLKPERQAVLDWLRLARHQAVDSYLPDSDTVRQSCLNDIAKCDLYVLILGHRYGFQPSDDNPEGLSITHLEYRRAGECGIPRVALLRTSIPDVYLSDLQDPARAPLVLGFRDEVARQVRPAEFSDLQGLIQGLSTGVQGQLDKRDERGAGEKTAGRALRLAPRPVFLAGREALLAELDARLAGDRDAGPRVVALCGLGGVGKSSVALEYAHRQLGQVGVAWQFPAEDPRVIVAGFGELADQLGAADRGDSVAWVHGVLAASPAPWLLVFDNAPDRASVAPLVPPAGPGRVVITSRNQIWPPGQAVDVPVLDPRVAAEFLVDRTGDADRQSAFALAGELGGLPLALEGAAAYAQASGDSLAGYLSLFRQRRADLLRRGEPTGYSQTVATTWTLAFEDLQQAAPGAAGLLRLLAFCAPEAIPLRLLLQPRPGLAGRLAPEVAPVLMPLLEDLLAAGDAIAALRRYSLITSAAGGSVSVHRLVQAVTADLMPAELVSRWQQAAAALIEDAIPGDAAPPGTWPVYAALLPHAQAALADNSDGTARMADYLGRSGSYTAARDLHRRVVEARERILAPEHPHLLAARSDLASSTGMAGDPAAARDLLAALLPVYERVLGPEHPDTLRARSKHARWTGEAGDLAAGRNLFAALLPVQERVLGPEHRETLRARSNHARWTGAAGDPAAARDQFAVLLPVRERVSGPEHPNTMAARRELAVWTGQAGDPAAARDQFAALLPAYERVLSPEHPDTLVARSNLAFWTGEAGDPAAARDLFAALSPAYERVLGPEHPHTLMARHDIAYWAGQAGDPAAARDQFAALLTVRERVLGPEHPDTLAARHELASWTGEAGDAASARDLFAGLVPVEERVLGPDHPDTLLTRHNLARWTGEAGDPAAARDLLAELVPVKERVLGLEHPHTLDARHGVALRTGQAGDPVGARDLFATLLPVLERVSGPEHPDTLTARANLARFTGQAGNPAAARDQFAKLLPVRERVSGSRHPDTLRTRGNLANWTGEAGDAAGARDLLAALLPLLERVLGPEHPRTLTTRNELARWTGEAGNPAAARDLLAELLPLRERVSGLEHPDTLLTRADLACWTEKAERGLKTA